MPPPGIAGAVSFFGASATIASVVIKQTRDPEAGPAARPAPPWPDR